MTTYLITGANRGLGLEFARQLSTRKDDTRILATAREPEKAVDLQRLVHAVYPLDVADPKSIEKLADHVKDQPIDVLINNAGVSSDTKSIATLDPEDMRVTFAVNAIGPLLVTKSVLKNLEAGRRKTVFNITSQLGSIANNKEGSSYAYRGSKAALNQMSVCLANEKRKDGFICVVVHPGWVKTDMGGPQATLEPEESIAAMIKLLDGLKAEDSGKFFNYDGKPMPW